MNVIRRHLKNVATLSSNLVGILLRKSRDVLFSKYLLTTNTVISLCSSGTGDLLQQHYEITRGRMDKWNSLRSHNIALTGIPVGMFCHFWYIYLDKFLPGRCLRNVGKKVILDQIICSPLAIGIYLVSLGFLENSSAKSMTKNLWDKGTTLYMAEWFIWPPAQLINFFFLPTHYRMLYDSAISLGFDCYYPYVTFGKEHRPSMSQHSDILKLGEESTEVHIVQESSDPIGHSGEVVTELRFNCGDNLYNGEAVYDVHDVHVCLSAFS